MSESIHRDHRSRMKARFAAQGLDGLNDHEALELLLYFAVPRVDTNPIAHRLLDTFGSLHGVIDASPDALKQVQGIGENAATLIVLLREMMRRYAIQLSTFRIAEWLTFVNRLRMFCRWGQHTFQERAGVIQ